METRTRSRCSPSPELILLASQATRTRRIQPRDHEKHAHPLATCHSVCGISLFPHDSTDSILIFVRHQVLLVPTADRVPYLVHLRLLRLFFQHLFLRMASPDFRERRTSMEDICLEYPHQCLLSAWCRWWSVSE